MKKVDGWEEQQSLSELQSNVTLLIQQVQDSKKPLFITQAGKNAAVILDYQEYESLLEKIELFQEIQTAESQLDQGMGIEQEEAKKQILSNLV